MINPRTLRVKGGATNREVRLNNILLRWTPLFVQDSAIDHAYDVGAHEVQASSICGIRTGHPPKLVAELSGEPATGEAACSPVASVRLAVNWRASPRVAGQLVQSEGFSPEPSFMYSVPGGQLLTHHDLTDVNDTFAFLEYARKLTPGLIVVTARLRHEHVSFGSDRAVRERHSIAHPFVLATNGIRLKKQISDGLPDFEVRVSKIERFQRCLHGRSRLKTR